MSDSPAADSRPSDQSVSLSLRLRPGVECAPWVISAVLKLEQEMAALSKDANRYRWLREFLVSAVDIETEKLILSGDTDGLDSIIDDGMDGTNSVSEYLERANEQ